MLFSITDYYELLALHRIVLEAKFHNDPDDRDIADSPIAAALANRIVEALQNAEALRGKPERVSEWERWRKVDFKGRFLENTVSYLRRHDKWSSMSQTERRDMAATLLAPFQISESDYQEFEKLVSASSAD